MVTTLFRRKKKLIINEPDPEYSVIYLGNVLTVLAKGDGCVDKPLTLIWRTYCSRTRPDLPMKLMITNTGLKATTKQQGLTEYWAHRITYCLAPSKYPRLFCWIYKHEGKKLKPELRCHAVLCKKVDQPLSMAPLLHNRIQSALRDYKREKICRQNLRLSSNIAGHPSLPRRRLMLSTGGQNFRPPMARSKSAPKLHSIDEDDEKEEIEEVLEELDDYFEEEPTNSLRTQISLESDGYSDECDLTTMLTNNNRRNSTFSNMQIIDLCTEEIDGKLILTGEADSVSEESGYHEEKTSLEEDDRQESDDNDCEVEITSL